MMETEAQSKYAIREWVLERWDNGLWYWVAYSTILGKRQIVDHKLAPLQFALDEGQDVS